MINVKQFYNMWKGELHRAGFNKNSTRDELSSMLVHFMNMGGLDSEELEQAMEIARDDDLFEELKAQL